jgi:hypothetical protein
MFWYTVDMVIYVNAMPFVLWIRSHKIGCHHFFFFWNKIACVLLFYCIAQEEEGKWAINSVGVVNFEEREKENERRKWQGRLKILKYCSSTFENVEFQRNYLFEKLKFLLIAKGRKKIRKLMETQEQSCFMPIQHRKAKQVSNSWQHFFIR